MISNEELLLELDGPGASPEEVDTVTLLRLASSYFDLLERLGRPLGLRLSGLNVHDKCIGLSSHPNSPNVARGAAQQAGRILLDEEAAPRGTGELAEELQKLLRSLPYGQSVKLILGAWSVPVRAAPTLTADELPFELTELRVRTIQLRVSGERILARFNAASESKEFSLEVSLADSRKLGEHLAAEADIEARVARDQLGNIREGQVLVVHELRDDSNGEAWASWYQGNSSEWDAVEDIEGELGR